MLADDFHVVGFGLVGNDPNGGVGGEGENDQPGHNDRWQDVKEDLKRGVVAVNWERPYFDMVFVRRVRLNTVAVAQHGQKHPAEGEDTDQNGPKHELIIEYSKHRVFCYHATTLFNRPCSPPLSVA